MEEAIQISCKSMVAQGRCPTVFFIFSQLFFLLSFIDYKSGNMWFESSAFNSEKRI